MLNKKNWIYLFYFSKKGGKISNSRGSTKKIMGKIEKMTWTKYFLIKKLIKKEKAKKWVAHLQCKCLIY